MAAYKKFKPINRLKKRLSAPGGAPAGDLAARADAKLETLRATILEGVDAKLSDIERLIASGALAEDGVADDIHRLANGVYAEAGTFNFAALSQAAYCLCELVSRADGDLPPHAKRLLAHVHAMRLLRTQGAGEISAVQKQLIASLKTLVEQLPPLPAPPKRGDKAQNSAA